MKIASWNVNSLKVRLQHVLDWLKESDVDVVCLQEIKLIDEKFPSAAFEEAGFNVAVHGQPTYNGVAIISKHPLEDIKKGLPGDKSDDQARYLEASVALGVGIVRIATIYLPNGNPVDTDKYPYKLKWMERLRRHTAKLMEAEERFVLAGDYNVIPTADDVHAPDAWKDDALFRLETRQTFRKIVNTGLVDAFRACHTEPHQYTFWDYQGGAWRKNHGIRIDHLLLSPQAADLLKGCAIDKYVREWEKPSDHVPIWCELDEAA